MQFYCVGEVDKKPWIFEVLKTLPVSFTKKNYGLPVFWLKV
jgi:hypothetical protein